MRALLSGLLTLAVLAGGAAWLGFDRSRIGASPPAAGPPGGPVAPSRGLGPPSGVATTPRLGTLFRWRDGNGTVHVVSELPDGVALAHPGVEVFTFAHHGSADDPEPGPASSALVPPAAADWRGRLSSLVGGQPVDGALGQLTGTLDELEARQETLQRLVPGP